MAKDIGYTPHMWSDISLQLVRGPLCEGWGGHGNVKLVMMFGVKLYLILF